MCLRPKSVRFYISAFAGLMTLLILFPLSGHVGKFVRRAQIQKMEKTDARVQTVTESKWLTLFLSPLLCDTMLNVFGQA